MAYLGSGMEEVEKTVATINMVCDTMVGDGSTTTMTIGATQEVPGSVNNVSVYFDGVAQRPTTDYTLSYKTVTFTTAPENAVKVTCLSYANEFLDVISDATVYSTGIEDNAVTAAKLGSTIASSKLTGTLPALDGSALTGVGVTPVTTSASDPTITTNPSGGLGTIWANSTSGEMYVLTDATASANVWTNVGSGFGDVSKPFGGLGGGTVSGYVTGGYGHLGSGPAVNIIEKYSLTSDGNASDIANLTRAAEDLSGTSSATHGYTSGGSISSTPQDTIDKFTFASDADATDVGNLTSARRTPATSSSTTHGYTSGGLGSVYSNIIDKNSYATDGNSVDVGDITVARAFAAGQSSNTHGYTSGGNSPSSNVIERFPFATDGNSIDVGDMTSARYGVGGNSSTTHGYISGGAPTLDIIDKFAFASTSNATDIGNLTVGRRYLDGCSSTTHGYICGGSGPSRSDAIDKNSFASDGNATDVGDLTQQKASAGANQA